MLYIKNSPKKLLIKRLEKEKNMILKKYKDIEKKTYLGPKRSPYICLGTRRVASTEETKKKERKRGPRHISGHV